MDNSKKKKKKGYADLSRASSAKPLERFRASREPSSSSYRNNRDKSKNRGRTKLVSQIQWFQPVENNNTSRFANPLVSYIHLITDRSTIPSEEHSSCETPPKIANLIQISSEDIETVDHLEIIKEEKVEEEQSIFRDVNETKPLKSSTSLVNLTANSAANEEDNQPSGKAIQDGKTTKNLDTALRSSRSLTDARTKKRVLHPGRYKVKVLEKSPPPPSRKNSVIDSPYLTSQKFINVDGKVKIPGKSFDTYITHEQYQLLKDFYVPGMIATSLKPSTNLKPTVADSLKFVETFLQRSLFNKDGIGLRPSLQNKSEDNVDRKTRSQSPSTKKIGASTHKITIKYETGQQTSIINLLNEEIQVDPYKNGIEEDELIVLQKLADIFCNKPSSIQNGKNDSYDSFINPEKSELLLGLQNLISHYYESGTGRNEMMEPCENIAIDHVSLPQCSTDPEELETVMTIDAPGYNERFVRFVPEFSSSQFKYELRRPNDAVLIQQFRFSNGLSLEIGYGVNNGLISIINTKKFNESYGNSTVTTNNLQFMINQQSTFASNRLSSSKYYMKKMLFDIANFCEYFINGKYSQANLFNDKKTIQRKKLKKFRELNVFASCNAANSEQFLIAIKTLKEALGKTIKSDLFRSILPSLSKFRSNVDPQDPERSQFLTIGKSSEVFDVGGWTIPLVGIFPIEQGMETLLQFFNEIEQFSQLATFHVQSQNLIIPNNNGSKITKLRPKFYNVLTDWIEAGKQLETANRKEALDFGTVLLGLIVDVAMLLNLQSIRKSPGFSLTKHEMIVLLNIFQVLYHHTSDLQKICKKHIILSSFLARKSIACLRRFKFSQSSITFGWFPKFVTKKNFTIPFGNKVVKRNEEDEDEDDKEDIAQERLKQVLNAVSNESCISATALF